MHRVTLVQDDDIPHATLAYSDGCPKSPISTFDPVGRLGNIFSSYANYIAIQWQLGYRLYLPARAKAELAAILENVTFPTISSLRKCGITNWHKQRRLEDFFNTVQSCEKKRTANKLLDKSSTSKTCLPVSAGKIKNIKISPGHNV